MKYRHHCGLSPFTEALHEAFCFSFFAPPGSLLSLPDPKGIPRYGPVGWGWQQVSGLRACFWSCLVLPADFLVARFAALAPGTKHFFLPESPHKPLPEVL